MAHSLPFFKLCKTWFNVMRDEGFEKANVLITTCVQKYVPNI